MAYVWDAANGHYRTERGRYIPASAIRRAVDATLDSLKSESDALAARLAAGTLDVDDWHVAMRALVKQAHTVSHLAAIGGRKRWTPSEAGKLGARVKAQYQFLSNFRREIANDAAGSPEAIAARARMYIQGGSQTYEAAGRRVAEATGKREMRRFTNSIRPCGDCLSYAGQGWVKIGELPDPGVACACGGACRCTVSYRTPTSEEPSAPKPQPPEPKPAKAPRKAPEPKSPKPPREAPLPQYGPSKAAVSFDDNADLIRSELSTWLGRSVKDADFASLVGAPDDAKVTVRYYKGVKHIEIKAVGDGYELLREVMRRDDGSVTIANEFFEVAAEKQGRGLGAAVFGRQVEQAARLGASRIKTRAVRYDEGRMVGYKVWPRFGYDGPIPDQQKANLPESLRSAERLSDLMRTPEGRAWWDAEGRSVDLTFDLAPDSLSRRAWDGYRRAKAKARTKGQASETRPESSGRTSPLRI